jgi:hypothetical protein
LFRARSNVRDDCEPVAPGASVSATFRVTSSAAAFNGDLVGNVRWANSAGGAKQSDSALKRLATSARSRSTSSATRSSSSYNSGISTVDISNWTLTTHATQQAIFSTSEFRRDEARRARLLPARPLELRPGGCVA